MIEQDKPFAQLPIANPVIRQGKTFPRQVVAQLGQGAYLTQALIPKLLTTQGKRLLKSNTAFQEELSAGLVSAALSTLTRQVFTGIFPTKQEGLATPFDCGYINGKLQGAELQVVCTTQKDAAPHDVTELIWDRIKKKNDHPYAGKEELDLAVIVTQKEYSYSCTALREYLKDGHPFQNYWLISPYVLYPEKCVFCVTYLWGGNDWYQFAIEATPNKSVGTNLFSRFMEGEPLFCLADLLREYHQE